MSVAFPTKKAFQTDAMREWIKGRMRDGLDTRDIAQRFNLTEAEIWNRLARTDSLPPEQERT